MSKVHFIQTNPTSTSSATRVNSGQQHVNLEQSLPRIAIHYGDGPGRGEITRMMLAMAGISYDDFRYPGNEFAAITKPDPTNKEDPTNGSPFPFNQMPALQVNGIMYAQTSSIARFAARLANLYPADVIMQLKSDQIFEHTGDIQYSTTPLFMDGVPGRAGTTMRPKEEREKAFQQWSVEKLPVMMSQLEHLLEPSGFFIGNSLSWADVSVFNRLENLNGVAKVYGVEVLNSYPIMKKHSEMVASIPSVKAYLNARNAMMEKHGMSNKSSGTYGKPGHYKITSTTSPNIHINIEYVGGM